MASGPTRVPIGDTEIARVVFESTWEERASASTNITSMVAVLASGRFGLMQKQADINTYLTARGLPPVEYYEQPAHENFTTKQYLILFVPSDLWQKVYLPLKEEYLKTKGAAKAPGA